VATKFPPYSTMTRGANLVIHFCPLLHVRVVYFLTLFLPIYISSTHLDYVCFPLACACTYLSNFAVSCLPRHCISVGTSFCIPFEFYCLSDHMLFTCHIHFQPSLLYVFYHCCSFLFIHATRGLPILPYVTYIW
jgi:hypothetical protein